MFSDDRESERTDVHLRAPSLLREFQAQQSLEALYALGVRRICAPLEGPERLEIGTVSGRPVRLPHPARAASGARWNALTTFSRADTLPASTPPADPVAPEGSVAPMAGQRVLAFSGDTPIANGTIGWNFMGRDGRYYFLSNWHVLCGYAKLGPEDGHRLRFVVGDGPGSWVSIGSLHRSWPAVPGGFNMFDVAVGRYDPGIVPAGRFRPVSGVDAPYPQLITRVFRPCECFKVGATSGLRRGRLVGWATIAVDPPVGRKYWMTSQLEVESADDGPPALAGDSGSVWVDSSSVSVLGVHWGVSNEGRAYASPLAGLGWSHRGMVEGLPMLRYPTTEPSSLAH